jgi:RNA-directed DNA polymerase
MRVGYELVLAEKAVQLYRDTAYRDLITFEEDIARIASIVVVIAESAGSLAELGAFSASDTIRSVLRVLIQQDYEASESFVRYGPIQRVINSRRDYLGVYPWRLRGTGKIVVSTIKPHIREIRKFIAEHVRVVPVSTVYSVLGEARLFYFVYWVIYLCLAVDVKTLCELVRLIYHIPKKHGGWRTIAQPSREVKAIQRYILTEKLSAYPVHHCAMAYVRSRSIRDNATAHRTSNAVLKLDFQNFFPSITVRDWQQFVRKNPSDVIDLKDLPLYSKILFWGQQRKSTIPRCLSIGAPTSPILSNILLFDLDVALSAIATELNVKFTRYADDITVSGTGSDAVVEFERRAKNVIKSKKSPKLTFNEEKRGLYLRGQRRMVTGLIVTPASQISIGRKRKRTISSLLHRSSLGQLNIKQRGFLKGMLGFCIATEPTFMNRMRTKYGNTVIDTALQFHVPSRAQQELDVA